MGTKSEKKDNKKAVKTEVSKVKEKSKKQIQKEPTEKIDKVEVIPKSKESEKRYATFLERLGAFIVDIFLISMVVSLITMPFSPSKNYEKLTEESSEMIKQYQKGKIDEKTYLSRVNDISYDMARETGLISIIEIFIFALYFVVVQYKYNGQTLGKKLLKIKIEKANQSVLTINDIMFRALMVDLIVYYMITLCLSMFASKNIFLMGTLVLEIIQYSLLFISAIMILSRKDKRGIHDLITKTQVVKIEE